MAPLRSLEQGQESLAEVPEALSSRAWVFSGVIRRRDLRPYFLERGASTLKRSALGTEATMTLTTDLNGIATADASVDMSPPSIPCVAPGRTGSLVTVKARHGSFIGSLRVGPVKGQYIANVGPVNGRPFGEAARSSQEGAEWLIGGHRTEIFGECDGGYYFGPTVLNGHDKMRIFQEEIFGPVIAVTTFKDEAEAVETAHDTRYGFGAGVWIHNGNLACRMGRAIKAGRVWTKCFQL